MTVAAEIGGCHLLLGVVVLLRRTMDDIVHLGESSQCPSTKDLATADCDFRNDFLEDNEPVSVVPPGARGATRGRGRSGSGRSSPVLS